MSPDTSHPSGLATSPTEGLSLAARQLLQQIQNQPSARQTDDELVDIPDTADNAYWAYEQLRNAVEYQEQHLLMRSSISRFLTRTFNGQQTKHESLGFEVVRELTKARYLANGTVAQSTVELLNQRLLRYRQLYTASLPAFKDQQQLFQLIVGIASADTQRILLPNQAQDAIINFTYHSYQGHTDPNSHLESAEDATALYAAVHKALLRSDKPTIHHYMFENQFPEWYKSDYHARQAATHLAQFFENIETAIQGKRAGAINRMVRSHIAPYVILHQTLQESSRPEELLAQPEKLSTRASQVAEEQYKKSHSRLRAGVVRAIIFLFITKMLIALALEIPYEYFVLGELHWLPLSINLLFPPVYMLLIGLTIKRPNFRNTDQIVRDLRAVLYQEGKLRYSLGGRIGQGGMGATFNAVYLLCSLGVIIGLGFILNALQFNLVSGVIFFIFLSTVSFFGYRISQSVRELVVVEKRNIFDMLWSVAMTPFIRLGQWFSDRYSRFNIFMLILDLIIEAPFKTLLRFYEQWAAFLREKQDDVLK